MPASLSYCAWGCFRYFCLGGGVGRRSAFALWASARQPSLASREVCGALACQAEAREASEGWWARQDSNLQPDRYERPALTIELQAPPRAAERRPATVPAPFTGPVAIRQSRAQSTET